MTLLLHDRDDRGVVTLTLNRPLAFNALSEALIANHCTVLDGAVIGSRST